MSNNSDSEKLISQLIFKINEQSCSLESIYNSPSWRFTYPLRKIEGAIRKHFLRWTRLDLVPVQQLQKNNKNGYWTSLGDDPQFILRPVNPAVMRQSGWAVLEFEIDCEKSVILQVFLDVGDGFTSDIVLNLAIDRPGKYSLPVYLPQSLRSLRLDPVNVETVFAIKSLRLQRVRNVAFVDSENKGVLGYLESLDQIDCKLIPLHQISRNLSSNFHWNSTGEDPHFSLIPNGEYLSAGWSMVDIVIDNHSKKMISKIYLDTGPGFNEFETISLPHVSNEGLRRIFFCEQNVLAMRFDPKEVEGGFSIKKLKIFNVNFEEAKREMLSRLISLEGKTSKNILREIEGESQKRGASTQEILLERYNKSFQEPNQQSIDYQEWIEKVEKANLPTAESAALEISAMERHPLISIVMPVFNTDEKHLKACIDSVIAQTYPYWELCIADDASPMPHIKELLTAYTRQDARIKVVYRKKNGHISRASNSALEIAKGDYVALLDHDDALPEHALFYIAKAINNKPEAQIIYSDEDKIDTQGNRFDPHFKSDWNPDLFFSQNYVSHLSVYRRELLQRIKGFRAGVEGSQDQDLLLRCLPHVKAENIVHIPHVLYHWRTVEGSTALASGEKSYTTEAGIQALRHYFKENGPKGVQVEAAMVPNTYRVRWPIPDEPPLVSLLIPTRDRKQITEVAVRSILEKTTYSNYEILILDNGSIEPETLEFFDAIQKQDRRVRVLRYDHPFNYSEINNFGEKNAKGSIIGLINNDVEVISPEWLTEMVSHAIRPDIGCVGAKLYYGNDTIQHAGIIMGIGGVAGHSHKHFARNHLGYFSRLVLTQNLSGVTAACLLVRREVYRQVGGLDEVNLKVAFNDVDFCLKVKEAGYRNLWTPYAELYHHESISRGQEDNPEKIARFNSEIEFMKTKWGNLLANDVFYSQNLTKDREDFSI